MAYIAVSIARVCSCLLLVAIRSSDGQELDKLYSVTKSVTAQVNKPMIGSASVVPEQMDRLEMSTEYFYIPERVTKSATTSTTPIAAYTTTNTTLNEVLRNEVWTLPILVVASISMFLMFAFEVFVLCKASRTTPSRRHLFLGQMLLLGLFSCSALAAVITCTPTPFTCATIRFGIGFSYALVFAALLVKCVFLISLNSGVYLPAPYQGLLLFFAVLIQVAIGAQWLINTPPKILTLHPTRHRLLVTVSDITQNTTLCETPYIDILTSLIYVVCLIIFVAILAVKSRGIRDNYRESTYIGLAVGFVIPSWLMWTLSGLVVVERYRDACLAVGLIITSLIIFLVMFLPKGRQLAAMGKEGVYVEDREDRFSSLSRAGSTGYSPSFFHFKPMKYNNGGVTPVTTNSHKRHPATVTTLGGGDHVALYPVTSNYKQMYHCYPYTINTGFPAALHCHPSPALPPLQITPFSGSIFLRSDDGNVYTTLEPTLSSNPNVYFQRGSGLLHPGMMY